MPFVYLPDDEPETHQFNGTAFTLRPNGTTEFVDHIADAQERAKAQRRGAIVSPWAHFSGADIASHLADRLAPWGTVMTEGPVVDGVARTHDDQERVDLAEKRYLVSTKAWCEERVLAYEKANKLKREAGLSLDAESDELKTARHWLNNYAPRLKREGLVA